MFVDLSKASDTVDHHILLKKIQCYSIVGNNQDGLKTIWRTENSLFLFFFTEKATVTCGVPQEAILGRLLFLLYVNDLHHASKVPDRIMLLEDTILFISQSDVNILFEEMNKELVNVNNSCWISYR